MKTAGIEKLNKQIELKQNLRGKMQYLGLGRDNSKEAISQFCYQAELGIETVSHPKNGR